MKNLLIISTLLLGTQCRTIPQQQNLCGYYESNFAEGRFFERKIQLNKDSTYKYEFSGDVSYYKETGKYSLNGDIVNLYFDPFKIDTTDDYPFDNPADTLQRPGKLLYKDTKLFIYKNGVLNDRAISKYKRQFLLLGKRIPWKRKLYLKKIKGKELIWTFERGAGTDH